MPNLTPEQARRNLFADASKLTNDQMPEIFVRFKKLMDKLAGEFLWPAVRSAHQAKGIKEEKFARDLFIRDGLTTPLHRKTDKWDDLADPYSQLDLQAWCRYLLYGKDREVDKRAVPPRKAVDQDAFFEFIGVPMHYSQKMEKKDGQGKTVYDAKGNVEYVWVEHAYAHRKYTDFCAHVDKVRSLRNIIEHENYVAVTELNKLSEHVFSLHAVISGISHISWKEKQYQWKEKVLREFYEGIGEIDYTIPAVMDYLDAIGHPVAAEKQSAFEMLLLDAGIAVENGKMSFSGDIIDFLSSKLGEAWELTSTDWTAGVAKVKKATQGALPAYRQLSNRQKLWAAEVLDQCSRDMKDLLVKVAKEAHKHYAITPETFKNNLFIAKGTGDWTGSTYKDDAPLLDSKAQQSKQQDPYQLLSLHDWIKYLRFGGCRQYANGDSVKDQDALFGFLGIPYGYTSGDPRRLDCEIGNHLEHLNDARNNITGHMTPASIEHVTTQQIVQWYDALLALLRPMSKTQWHSKEDCEKLLEALKGDFMAAIGGLTYAVADILAYLKMSETLQPEVELRLAELGFKVSEGLVTIDEDVETFMEVLPAMIRMTRDFQRLPEDEEANKKYGEWIKDRARASEERVVQWFQKGAQRNPPMPAAVYYLGCCGLFGRGVEADRNEAFAMIRSAAKKGYAPAQVRMGQYCEDWEKQLRKPKEEEALQWYQKAADQENADGLYHVGRCYRHGIGTDWDEEAAYQYYWEAEQMGHLPAKFARGRYYVDGFRGIRGGAQKAEKIFQELVEKEYVPAMKELADIYTHGFYNRRDTEKAKALYLKAAYHGDGDASALRELGKAYMHGDFRESAWTVRSEDKQNWAEQEAEDQKEAVYWFGKAAEQGDAEAMYMLSACYQSGVGVEKNEKTAFHWIQQAAEKHNAAKFELANCYAGGIGVREDMDKAKKLYREAEDSGVARRMSSLLYNKECIHARLLLKDVDRVQMCQTNLWTLMELEKESKQDDFNNTRFVNYTDALDRYELAEMYEIAFALQANTTPQIEETVEKNILENPRAHFQYIGEFSAQQYKYIRVQEEDLKTAFALYEQAAKTGLKKAMRAVGRCYEQGIGVDKNVYRAIEWYKKAALEDDTLAMVALADCYLQNTDALSEKMDAKTAREKAIRAYQIAYRKGAPGVWKKLRDLGVDVYGSASKQ